MLTIENQSVKLREKVVIQFKKKVLIAKIKESNQEKDLTEPVNCQGYGRIRHFRIDKHKDWSPDPLPNLPAAKAFGITPESILRAQVFQLAACNFHCWYCFVDYNRLSADQKVSKFFSAHELIDMFKKECNPPYVIDLSGGQPDLVPEWTFWMMEAIRDYGMEHEVFLWSDDNLSCRHFWKFLSPTQRRHMVNFSKYSRVGCFKGYDEKSFHFNTQTSPELFNRQFEIFNDLFLEGFDIFAYVIFTDIPNDELKYKIEQFVNKLQKIHINLPLRTVPLKIEEFTPMKCRIADNQLRALSFQNDVHNAWCEELKKRFSEIEMKIPICDIQMKA